MIHREGRISVLLTFFVFAVVGVAVILAFGVNWITLALSVVLLGLFCFTAYFFRDPHRGNPVLGRRGGGDNKGD